MPNLKFTSADGLTTWTASCARTYPVNDAVEVGVVVDYAEGNELYAYDKGGDVQFFELAFNKLNAVDDTALRNFHQNICRGPLDTFTYIDQAGVAHTVRWLDTRYPIRNTKHNDYVGTIKLREEI